MKPEFNHCYTPDPKHHFHSSLRRMGFTPHPRTVAHPGGHSCRFIMLRARDGRTPLYLEFSSAPPRHSRRPGVSFSVRGSLEAFAKGFSDARYLRPRLKHRNYEWKTRGQKERLAGWNFLSFGRHCPYAEVWYTEYEPEEGKTRRPAPPAALMRHANGVLRLLALEFDANDSGRRYLSAALGRKLGERTRLACGTDIVLRPSRRNAFRAVVLRARSLAAFRRRAKGAVPTEHDGRPALFLKNPAGFWDIVVQEP